MSEIQVFVSPHACRSYRQRVYGNLTAEQAVAEITEALQQPLFHCPSGSNGLTLWGCLNRIGHQFVVATDPADEGAEFLLVRTCGPRHFWHETKRFWREHADRLSTAKALR